MKQKGQKLVMVTFYIPGSVEMVIQCFGKGFSGRVIQILLQGLTMKGCITLNLKYMVISPQCLVVLNVGEIMRVCV